MALKSGHEESDEEPSFVLAPKFNLPREMESHQEEEDEDSSVSIPIFSLRRGDKVMKGTRSKSSRGSDGGSKGRPTLKHSTSRSSLLEEKEPSIFIFQFNTLIC